MSPYDVAIVFEVKQGLGAEFFRTGILEVFKEAQSEPISCEIEMHEPGLKGFSFGEAVSNAVIRSQRHALLAREREIPLLYMTPLKFEFVDGTRSCEFSTALSLAYQNARLIGRNFKVLSYVAPTFRDHLRKRRGDVAEKWPPLKATAEERRLANEVIKRAIQGIRFGHELFIETQRSDAKKHAN
jgi:hypothetical protein